MAAIDGRSILSQMQWRYATKKFDPSQRISDADWKVLEETLVLTPSSFGMQPWKFFVVTDPAIKAKLPEFSWRQTQPVDCSHMLVLAIRDPLGVEEIDRFVARTAEVRGQSIESLAGLRKMLVGSLLRDGFDLRHWATNQVYIALGQFMACAALMGIDACPMEGIDPAKYDQVLGLREQGYATCVACAAGYRATDDKYASLPKVRYAAEDIIATI